MKYCRLCVNIVSTSVSNTFRSSSGNSGMCGAIQARCVKADLYRAILGQAVITTNFQFN